MFPFFTDEFNPFRNLKSVHQHSIKKPAIKGRFQNQTFLIGPDKMVFSSRIYKIP